MKRSYSQPGSSRRPGLWLLAAVALALVAVLALGLRVRGQALLYNLTGEEQFFPQLKGLSDLAMDALRPQPRLASDAAIRYANVNPFGVNVFLNEEVDPAKRERVVQMAAAAGFHWLRQEFPWQDIEIAGKGDFEDRRNGPAKSAWDKYDNIVDLAERYHMELVVRVSTPPSWSRQAGDAVGTFAPPDNLNDYGDFVAALVSRYKGRVRYYQLWNEPNIYPEWGTYSISPEKYTELLKIGATRARQADPNVVIIAGALASTIDLQPDAPAPNNSLNDLLFLQRMYDAGAAPYFDIMSMQGYGLWSGPTDRRMQPRVMNFGRPQYVRDVMVANGDSQKPIWISEMAWNAVPDSVADKRFGQVTPAQQGAYEVQAFQRVLDEWPWAGVVNTWYFKRATDEWVTQGKPEAYFQLVAADFTPQPAYDILKSFLTGYHPTLDSGTHPADGWAITASGDWRTEPQADAPYGQVRQGAAGAALRFTIRGNDLDALVSCAGGAACSLQVQVDAPAGTQAARTVTVPAGNGLQTVSLARGLAGGSHVVVLTTDGPAALGGLTVKGARP